jgi:peptide/nickel transport system permease protein
VSMSLTIAGTSARRLVFNRFLKHRLAVISSLVLGVLVLGALAAPVIATLLGTDADQVNLFDRFTPPSWQHPLGTDELGRDVLVRLLYGGQVSLFVGATAAMIATIFGTGIGLIAGYLGGRFDSFLMRFTDGVIALPLLPFLIVLAALDMTKLGLPSGILNNENISLYRIIFIVALFGWTTTARLVRAGTLSLKERPFVLAAHASGASSVRIMTVHILPNLVSPIIVSTTLAMGGIILLESVLSFLGLGVQPPTPSWGNLLTNAQELIWEAPMLACYPGLLIFVTVIAFNFIGDGLQDALDPRALESD